MSIRLLAAILTAGMLYADALKAQNLYSTIDANSFFAVSNPVMPSGVYNTFGIRDGTNDLLVYPNPVGSSTKVVLNEASVGNVYVDVIDMNGVVERSYQYVPGSDILTVDMSKLPLGWYSLRVWGKEIGRHNIEVVKQ
jgi:hypothetical protein